MSEAPGQQLHDHAADAAGRRPDARHRTDGFLREHVRDRREEVGRPCLVRGGADADHRDREHRRHFAETVDIAEVLRGQHRQRATQR